MEWWNHKLSKKLIRSKGHNIVKCLVDNFGIQVDANNEFNGDECSNLKLPVDYSHCRKHPHFCILNSTFYVASYSECSYSVSIVVKAILKV